MAAIHHFVRGTALLGVHILHQLGTAPCFPFFRILFRKLRNRSSGHGHVRSRTFEQGFLLFLGVKQRIRSFES